MLERQNHWAQSVPVIVLLSLLGLTFFTWKTTRDSAHAIAEAAFSDECREIQKHVESRLTEQEVLLRGAVGLFNSTGEMSHSQWRRYVSALELDRFQPGILGLGFSVRLKPDEKSANMRKIRAEGFPEYTIKPEGERSVYAPVIYLEPFNWRNQRALGYDLYSELVRRTALDYAADQAAATLSGKITLLQETETDKQIGVLMIVPVYRMGALVDTVENRRAALLGFVYAPIRMGDFMKNILKLLPHGVEFTILDETSSLPDKKLFSNETGSPTGNKPEFTETHSTEVFQGRRWSFTCSSLPSFEANASSTKYQIILGSGILLSFFTFYILIILGRSRQLAVALAERKSQELASEEEFFHLLFNSTAEAICVLDNQGLCTYANQACLETLGFLNKDEILGKNLHELTQHMHVDGTRSQVDECDIITALKQGKNNHNPDGIFYKRDGNVLPVEYWSYPRLESGKIIGAVITFLNITERKLASEKLKVAVVELDTIFENISVGILVEKDGQYLRVNGALTEMMGYQTEDVWKLDWYFSFRSKQVYAQFRSEASIAFLQGKVFQSEQEIMRKDGSLFSAKLTGKSLDLKENKHLWVIEDISDSKNAVAQLIAAKKAADEASQLKSIFLANMSHEIRTPMNAIVGFSEILLENGLSPDQQESASAIHASGKNLLQIINTILDLSKVEADKMELDFVDFKVETLIDEVLDAVGAKKMKSAVELKVHLNPKLDPVYRGDVVRIRQILINLLANAVKFTARGTIKIAVNLRVIDTQQTTLDFSIADTGSGMKAEYLKKIFEPFSQEDSSMTRQHGGTGLGVSISKKLAVLMGGDIHYQSIEGQGTTVTVAVIVKNGVQDAALTQATPNLKSDTKVGEPINQNRLILVAEDTQVNQLLIKKYLTLWGYSAIFANNGKEVLALLKSKRVDLILMDVQMAIMDGLEATKVIRKTGSQIPIIGLSAHAMKQNEEQALASGMNDYITKPIDSTALQNALVKHLKDLLKIPEQAAKDIDQELYRAFIKDVNKKLLSYAELLESKRFADLNRLGHGIKSYAATYGHRDLGEIGKEIEHTALSENLQSLRAVGEKLRQYLINHEIYQA